MRTAPVGWNDLFNNPNHVIEYKISVAGTEYASNAIDSDSFRMVKKAYEDNLSVGTVSVGVLDVTFYPSTRPPRNAAITVYSRLALADTNGDIISNSATEWLQEGVFYINRRKRHSDGWLTVSCYDAALRMEEPYFTGNDNTSESGWPKAATDVVNTIMQKCGLTLDSRSVINSNYQVQYPEDLYKRDILEQIAAASGGNCFMTGENKFYICPVRLYENNIAADFSELEPEDFIVDGDPITVTGVEVKTSEDATDDSEDAVIYSAGSDTGYVLSAVLPNPSQAIADALYTQFWGVLYTPYKLVNIINPLVELGDTIRYDGTLLYVACIERDLSNADQLTISAPGSDMGDNEYKQAGTVRRAKRVLKQAVKDEAEGLQETIRQYLIDGNVTVSGDLSVESLYSYSGDFVDIIVDHLRTCRKIARYLAGDTSDIRYLDIAGEHIQFVSGVYNNGSEQAVSYDGEPLFWERDISNATLNPAGYPVDGVGIRIYTTTTDTGFPVMWYTYTEEVKAEFQFEQEGENSIYTPTLNLGAGNVQGLNKGYMRKGLDGLLLKYLSNTSREIGIHLTTDGFFDLYGVRRTNRIDFTNWASGSFEELIEGESNPHSYTVEKDEYDRPIKIYDEENHLTEIIYPQGQELDPVTSIFQAGIGIGNTLRGWSQYAGIASNIPIDTGNYEAIDFYEWAIKNGAPSEFASAEAYAAYIATFENSEVANDGRFLWKPTVADFRGNSIIMRIFSRESTTTLSASNNYSTGAFQLLSDLRSWRYSFALSGDRDNWNADLTFYDATIYAPFFGGYTWTGNKMVIGERYTVSDMQWRPFSLNYPDGRDNIASPFARNAGAGIRIGVYSSSSAGPRVYGTAGVYTVYLPEFYVTPPPDSQVFNQVRTGNIPGVYGIIQNETPIKLYSGLIVNETEKSIYNPITALAVTYTSWTYDYSNRKYTFTDSNNDTATVEYTDDEIIITDSWGTYNIKYLGIVR